MQTITSQGIAGTNISIGPDGKIDAALNSNALDAIFTPTIGGMITRGPTGWGLLAPGAPGQYLQTNGASAAPSWAVPTFTITSAGMDAAFGATQGSVLYRSAGGWALNVPPPATTSLLQSDGSATSFQTLTSFIDSSLGTTQGAVLYRSATAWTLLAPGTSGNFLQTQGAGANPQWAAAPAANVQTLLDGIATAQGTILYRGASAWAGLAPGTSGNFLQTQGAGANPQWAAASGGGSGFPSGTAMLFQQTAAPTGWTKQTTHNDKALRVVSGAASSGGTNAFSTVMAQTVVGSTTLSTAQMPSHNHSDDATTSLGSNVDGGGASFPLLGQSTGTTGGAGSGGSHNHTITMAMQYVDIIIATAP